MAPSNCPRCAQPYTLGLTPRRRSKDHILPREHGGTDIIHGDVRNTEIMCQTCNEFRANSAHCWALLACARAVARRQHIGVGKVLRRWGVQRWMADQNALTRHGYEGPRPRDL